MPIWYISQHSYNLSAPAPALVDRLHCIISNICSLPADLNKHIDFGIAEIAPAGQKEQRSRQGVSMITQI